MHPNISSTHQCYSAKSYMKFPLFVLIASLFFSSVHSQEEWRRLSTDDGLSGDAVLDILQAKNGDIWIGTAKGINRYNGVFESSLTYDATPTIFQSTKGYLIARFTKVTFTRRVEEIFFLTGVIGKR